MDITQQPATDQRPEMMTVQEALYALVAYTYIHASAEALQAINNLDPNIVVVNNLANPEIMDAYSEIKAAEDAEAEASANAPSADTIFDETEPPQ